MRAFVALATSILLATPQKGRNDTSRRGALGLPSRPEEAR